MEKQAKLVEIDNFKAPKGADVFYYQVKDGIKIRVAIWNKLSSKGTFVLQSGRTEFIEKYYEVVQELLDRSFCVVMFDWRGQGLSDRLTKNKYLGHVNRFKDYDLDLQEIFKEIITPECPQPYIGMSHSMGGSIMATFASKSNSPLKALILCAPMLNIKVPNKMKFLLVIIGALSWLGFRDMALKKPEWNTKEKWHEIPFNENNITSDETRYKRSNNLIKKDNNLAIGGVSIGWSHSAYLRTNSQNNKWAELIKIPTLLLSAKRDKLVDSDKNIKVCSGIPDHKIVELDGEHELLMEREEIRDKCWESIDEFISGL